MNTVTKSIKMMKNYGKGLYNGISTNYVQKINKTA